MAIRFTDLDASISDQDRPRIEFPCDYPVKVMGENAEDFVSVVVEIGQRHAPEVTHEHVTVRESGRGRWVSVTLTIRATGEEQIAALFEDLKDSGRVRLVL